MKEKVPFNKHGISNSIKAMNVENILIITFAIRCNKFYLKINFLFKCDTVNV